MADEDPPQDVPVAAGKGAAPAAKPKRVRTGCLTCRERHLKCDEAMPTCMNCRKSARVCKRGVRLNFIDTQCQKPPIVPAPEDGWQVHFQDESREIASEYQGGLAKYAVLENEPPHLFEAIVYEFAPGGPPAPAPTHQPLPHLHSGPPDTEPKDSNQNRYMEHQSSQHQQIRTQDYSDQRQATGGPQSNYFDQNDAQQYQAPGSGHSAHSHQSQHSMQHSQYTGQQSNHDVSDEEANDVREMLSHADETLYLQVFVEEVGLWMDTMDPMKHFSELLPFHALNRPMLLNAFLACGVRHLTLVNPAVYQEEKALDYYDKASRYLLRALENPERDSVICATTAVILNVYEIMTEKALPRMNHIAGARALIKECGWNAKSNGIGAACFWLNVGLETLSNLHFNWQASWPPDAWGLELDLEKEVWPGREEIWTHKMLYIIAKIGDFRATLPRAQDQGDSNRRQQRWQEWNSLKNLCDTWSNNIPRTMQPMAYLYPYQTMSKSAFPEVWLIKRTTIVARLFYHTAMVLLAQIHPIVVQNEVPEMKEMELQHAHQICGIVAHVKDRGVASIAIRSLAHAAECLTVRREQEEVLHIFTKIHKDTGWRIGFIPQDLQKKWGWRPEEGTNLTNPSMPNGLGGMMKGSPYQFDQYAEYQRMQQEQAEQAQARAQAAQAAAHRNNAQQYQQHTSPRRPAPPQGIVNPMFASADFSLSKHPYMENYVAPAHHAHAQHQQGGGGGGGGGSGLGLGLPPIGYSAMYTANQAPQYPSY